MNDKNYHTTRYQSKQFSEYIDCFKIYRFYSNAPVKLHPEGHFELIFQLNGIFLHNTVNTNGWEERPKNFIGGLHNKSYFVKPSKKNIQLLSIQFKANCAKYFIPDELNLFKNKIIDIRDVYDSSSLEQLNYLSTQVNPLENLSHIENLLITLFEDKSNSPIDNAIKIMNHKKGFVRVSSIAKKIGLSDSHFRKKFNEEIGMSPKEYSKIIRFNHIIKRLSQHPKINLTQLAYQLGYFDQSHFIKDFQSVTGTTPRKHALSGCPPFSL